MCASVYKYSNAHTYSLCNKLVQHIIMFNIVEPLWRSFEQFSENGLWNVSIEQRL